MTEGITTLNKKLEKEFNTLSWPDGWYEYKPSRTKIRIQNSFVVEASPRDKLLIGIKAKRLKRVQFEYIGETL